VAPSKFITRYVVDTHLPGEPQETALRAPAVLSSLGHELRHDKQRNTLVPCGASVGEPERWDAVIGHVVSASQRSWCRKLVRANSPVAQPCATCPSRCRNGIRSQFIHSPVTSLSGASVRKYRARRWYSSSRATDLGTCPRSQLASPTSSLFQH
jgi:hypothetical protein